jgi:hypothetical protein
MANKPEEIQKSNESHEAHFLRKLFAGHLRDDTSINPRNPRPGKKSKRRIYYERQNSFQDQ